MDQDSKAPQEKHAGGLRRTAINVLVPLFVFLVPLILYLLYISKQDQYFRTYYQRELGGCPRIAIVARARLIESDFSII